MAVFEEAEYRLDQSQICRIRQLGNLIIPPSCNATLLIINHSTNSTDGSTTGICIAASSVTKARLSLKAGAKTDGRAENVWIYCATRIADELIKITLSSFLPSGAAITTRDGGGVGVRGEEGEGEGQVDPPLIGGDWRLNPTSIIG